MVQGIKLFNKGGKIADNVMISISYKESLIKDIQIEDENVKNPPIVDGGIGYNFVVLRFDKIPPIHRTTLRKPIIFSLTVLDLKSGPDVVIKYGVDKRATEQKNEYDRPLRDTIAIFIGICALLWIVFGNPIGIYAELAVTSFIIVNWIFSRRN